MKASKQRHYTIPCQLPERTFIHETTSDKPTYLVFQMPQLGDTDVVIERMEDFSSSFVDLATVTSTKTDALLGYCITVKRGFLTNLGVSLVVRKSRLNEEFDGQVNLLMSNDLLKLGDLLRIVQLGDGAIFIGAVNEYPPFFY